MSRENEIFFEDEFEIVRKETTNEGLIIQYDKKGREYINLAHYNEWLDEQETVHVKRCSENNEKFRRPGNKSGSYYAKRYGKKR